MGRAKRPLAAWLVMAAVLTGVAGGAVLGYLKGRRPPPPAGPTPAEELAAAWRANGLVPSGTPDAHVAAGREALAADLPARSAEARRHFQQALALDPGRLDAVAGYATSFAALAGEDPDGGDLQACHRLVRWGLSRGPGRPDLLAAWARVLLLSPGAANRAEALEAAQKAVAARADAHTLLALAEARMADAPGQAAEAAERALSADPAVRRALVLAAEGRWRAGEAGAALALLARRLALDPAQPVALGLQAEMEIGTNRPAAARRTLERWAVLAPQDPEPLLGLARMALQLDGDPAEARRRLDRARELPASDFQAARALALLAATERMAGDLSAAERAVEKAVARVPGNGPARYQEALLAFARRDARGLHVAAGVVGGRAGHAASLRLAAMESELKHAGDEPLAAWEAAAAASEGDLAAQLAAAGALARLEAPGRALPIVRRAALFDPSSAKDRGTLTDYWDGPAPLRDAAAALARAAGEPRVAGEMLAAAATCELLAGRTEEAEALARRAAREGPQLSRPHEILAQIHLDARRPRQALAAAKAGVEADEGSAVALALRARALEAEGRLGEALEAHRQALAVAPALATARLGEARLLLRAARREQALTILRTLVSEPGASAAARGLLLEAEGKGAPAPGR